MVPTDRAAISAKRPVQLAYSQYAAALVALVEVAAMEEVAVEVVLLDVEVQLEERLAISVPALPFVRES